MKDQPKCRADQRQVAEVETADHWIQRPIEIEGDELAIRPKDPGNLIERPPEKRHISKAIASRDHVERAVRKWQFQHICPDEARRGGTLPLGRREFEHPPGDIEADDRYAPRRGEKGQIARARGEVESPRTRTKLRRLDQPSFPAAVETTGENDRNEIVAIGDARKEAANVPALVGGCGERLLECDDRQYSELAIPCTAVTSIFPLIIAACIVQT